MLSSVHFFSSLWIDIDNVSFQNPFHELNLFSLFIYVFIIHLIRWQSVYAWIYIIDLSYSPVGTARTLIPESKYSYNFTEKIFELYARTIPFTLFIQINFHLNRNSIIRNNYFHSQLINILKLHSIFLIISESFYLHSTNIARHAESFFFTSTWTDFTARMTCHNFVILLHLSRYIRMEITCICRYTRMHKTYITRNYCVTESCLFYSKI